MDPSDPAAAAATTAAGATGDDADEAIEMRRVGRQQSNERQALSDTASNSTRHSGLSDVVLTSPTASEQCLRPRVCQRLLVLLSPCFYEVTSIIYASPRRCKINLYVVSPREKETDRYSV